MRQFRAATAADLRAVEDIFESIFTKEETGPRFTVFERSVYPTLSTAQKALQEDSLFVCEEDGHIKACLICNQTQPPEYGGVPWNVAADPTKALVLHLLCVHADFAGQGLGKDMVSYALQRAKNHGCQVVRLDTGGQNLPARHLYESKGFVLAGTGTMDIGGVLPHTDHLFYEYVL